MENVVGQWVAGSDFFGRDAEVQALTDLIDRGQHVLLAAPRRVGKTSLMREVSNRIEDRYTCLHVDLEASHSPAEALAELACATRPHVTLWAKTKGVFNNALAQLKAVDKMSVQDLSITFREGAGATWAEKGDALLGELAAAERPVVLFIDELPILVCRLLHGDDGTITPERREAADRLLSWLRRATQRGGSLRIVLSGSIGLEPVLRLGRLSATINAFTPFTLEPWDQDVAMSFVRALAGGDRLPHDAGVPERLTALLGACVPYHVQLFFHHLKQSYDRERSKGRTKPLTVDEVNFVYQDRMLASGGHAYLAHSEERLSTVLGVEAGLAQDLLTEAAIALELTDDSAVALSVARAGPDRDARRSLRQVLDVLEHDGYLRVIPGRRIFVSNLLRDWWALRYGFGYVPVAQRPRAG